ncbi:MAG TPA: hypothetical protein VHR65_07680 [Solirubrobacterales bacterium]|nr:hypothetical protein [Solirubrobacterales bacterium]
MALTDDQKAMLRLLAQREDGYDDMAALMGISVEEVRDRVKGALTEVDEPAAAAEAPSEAPAAAAPPPEPPRPVSEEPAPPPPPPAPAPEPQASTAKASPRKPRSAGRPQGLPALKLPKDRGALIGLGAGALVVVIFVVVLIVGGSGGGSSPSASSAEGSASETTAASENSNLTQAILAPVDGSDSSGAALFGRVKKKVLLQVTAKGLEPSQSGQSYAIWLSHSGKAMVPVGTAKVPASGDLAARFQVPAAVIVLVARSAFNEIDLSRTSDAALSAAIAKARKEKAESTYTGADVMRGKITGPFVGATAKNKE